MYHVLRCLNLTVKTLLLFLSIHIQLRRSFTMYTPQNAHTCLVFYDHNGGPFDLDCLLPLYEVNINNVTLRFKDGCQDGLGLTTRPFQLASSPPLIVQHFAIYFIYMPRSVCINSKSRILPVSA